MQTSTIVAPTILTSQANSQDEPSQSRIDIKFLNIQRKLKNLTFLANYSHAKTRQNPRFYSLGHNKKITLKMRIKLLKWLQTLSLSTFNFSCETFLLSIKILDQYLCLTNQPFTQLQLIGCGCLYLASKINESTIVAGMCYVVAAGGIFDEERLMKKQMDIYKVLNYDITFVSLVKQVYMLFRVYNIVVNLEKYDKNNVNVIRNQQNIDLLLQHITRPKLQKLLIEIATSIQFKQFHQHQIIQMLISFIEVQEQLPDQQKLITLLRKQKQRNTMNA